MRVGVGGLVLIGACLTLLSAPVVASTPEEVGHLPPDEVFENRLSLVPCNEISYVGENEPFTVAHGWGLTADEHAAVGRYRFELSLNGERLTPTFYNVVTPGAPNENFSFIRWFAFDFPDGLVTGDALVGEWYDPDGLSLECQTAIVNGDPPA